LHTITTDYDARTTQPVPGFDAATVTVLRWSPKGLDRFQPQSGEV